MWPFKRNSAAKQQPLRQDRVAVPFSSDIADLPVLKYHAVRALCGVFMDRHSSCQSPHPFCGDISANVVQLIANAVQQVSPDGPVIAIYLSKAVNRPIPSMDELIDPWEAVVSLDYADKTPYRKLVVCPVSNSNYYMATHGPILNPVEGDYATGRIDPNATRTIYSNPEPRHTRWQYWECELFNEDGPVIAIYIIHGEAVVSLDYADKTPYRKLVVCPVSNSNYYMATHGPILNPVEGDYATGRIDPNATRTIYSNPEPRHTRWQYWECELFNEDIIPEFRCLMVHGEWWIVDADREQGLVQQVAALSVADDPEHNFGIHAREGAVYMTDPRDNSEYAKVIRENCPVM